MGIEPFLVASSVKRRSLAQRLLRKLCQKCKSPIQPTLDQINELHTESTRDDVQFFRAVGCDRCNYVGYKGRTAVYEVLPIQNGISELIGRGISAGEIRKFAAKARRPTVAPEREEVPPHLNFAPMQNAVDSLARSADRYRKALSQRHARLTESAVGVSPLSERAAYRERAETDERRRASSPSVVQALALRARRLHRVRGQDDARRARRNRREEV